MSPAPAHKGAESGPICAPASLQSTENVRTARAQAPEVKSDSRYVRFVIAKHSPERVSVTGLRIEAREKNRCNGSDAAERSFSLVWFVEEIPRKVGLFRLFQEKRSRVSLQWRLRGGGRWIRTLDTVSHYPVRSGFSATCQDSIPGTSAAEKRIRLGHAIEQSAFCGDSKAKD